MFTDRFIKFPIKLYNKETKELTGVYDTRDTYRMVNPLDISIYGPHIDEEGFECVNMWTKGGDSINIYLRIDEFEQVINKHFK